jgi:mannose-6-phosphate isomerase-like protein (cupin superfamily)
MRTGDELENPVTGERAVVREGADDTGGDHLLVDLFVRPGGRVPLPHLHPTLTETFEVIEGRVGVVVDGRRTVACRGERVTVPPGTVHDWWNGGESEAHALVEVRGPGVARFEVLLATFWALARDGKSNRRGVPNPLQLAVTVREFSDVFRVAKPAPWIQAVVFGMLAPIGRALGYRPTYSTQEPRRRVVATPADAGSGRSARRDQ